MRISHNTVVTLLPSSLLSPLTFASRDVLRRATPPILRLKNVGRSSVPESSPFGPRMLLNKRQSGCDDYWYLCDAASGTCCMEGYECVSSGSSVECCLASDYLAGNCGSSGGGSDPGNTEASCPSGKHLCPNGTGCCQNGWTCYDDPVQGPSCQNPDANTDTGGDEEPSYTPSNTFYRSTGTASASGRNPTKTSSSEDSSVMPPSPPKVNAGAIAGGVIGGLVVIAGIVGIAIFVIRRKKTTKMPEQSQLMKTDYQGAPVLNR